jgi:hypothetical protein
MGRRRARRTAGEGVRASPPERTTGGRGRWSDRRREVDRARDFGPFGERDREVEDKVSFFCCAPWYL